MRTLRRTSIVALVAVCFVRVSLAGVTLDAAGFSNVTRSSDSKAIYVDAVAGADTNAGTEAAPLRTPAAGYAALRTGFPDHLYFRRGQTFNGNFGFWKKSGRSVQEPMYVGAYGDPTLPPPKIVTGQGSDTGGIYSINGRFNSLFVQSIDFEGGSGTPTDGTCMGFRLIDEASRDIVFEDVSFRRYANGVVIQSGNAATPIRNITFRRCVIADNYGITHSQGVQVVNGDNIRFVECVIDSNGYNRGGSPAPNIRAHNVYMQKQATNFLFEGCISSRASSHGIATGTGGTIRDCLIVANPIGIQVRPAGTLVERNCIFSTRTLAGGDTRCGILCLPQWGDDSAGGQTPLGPLNVRDNLMARSNATSGNTAIAVDTGSNPVLAGNGSFMWDTPGWDANAAKYVRPANAPDTSRSPATYAATLGLAANEDAFLDRAKLNRRHNWDPRFTASAANAYLLGGYGIGGVVTPPPPPPPAPMPVVSAGADVALIDTDRSGSEPFTLTGTATVSSGSIASSVWTLAGTQVGTGLTFSGEAPVGSRTYRLTATTDQNQTAFDEVTVTVVAGPTPPPPPPPPTSPFGLTSSKFLHGGIFVVDGGKPLTDAQFEKIRQTVEDLISQFQ